MGSSTSRQGVPSHVAFSRLGEVGADRIAAALREWNRHQVSSLVGDKYVPDLFVIRAAEQDLSRFLTDPRDLSETCIRTLKSAADPETSLLTPTERQTLLQTADAFSTGVAFRDPSLLPRIGTVLLSRGYDTLLADVSAYRQYIQSHSAQLDVYRLNTHHVDLERKLLDAKAPYTLLDRLRDVRNITTAEEVKRTGADPGTLSERVRKATNLTSEREHARLARAFDAFERDLRAWGRSKVVAKERGRQTLGADLFDLCRRTVDAGRANCFIIVDAAGSGKTNLLCDLSLRETSPSPCVIIFPRSFGEVPAEIVVPELDAAASSVGFANFDEMVETLHSELERRRSYIAVLIDGINEYSDDDRVGDAIRKLMRACALRRVRFVVSCRDIYWRHFKKHFEAPLAVVSEGQLKYYSDSEFDDARRGYLKAYGLRTQVEGEALEAFRSPILLRFFCEAYGTRTGASTPDAPLRVKHLNLKRLFDDYIRNKLERTVEVNARKRKYEPNIPGAGQLQTLVFGVAHAMRNNGKAVLDVGAVRSALGDARGESRVSPYNLLLDEDIIIEERSGRVYFVYEAFMEYAIARGALAGRKTKRSAMHALDQMVVEAKHFRNMSGVILMALVMLAEERGVFAFEHILKKGAEWNEIVLRAIEQLDKESIGIEVLDALEALVRTGTTSARREALRILFVASRGQGRRKAIELLAEGRTKRRRDDAIAVAHGIQDALLVDELLRDVAHSGGRGCTVEVLMTFRLSRRAVDRVLAWLDDGDVNLSEVCLRILVNVVPGEYRRVLKAVEKYRKSSHATVRTAAQSCWELVTSRAADAERTRRKSISRARRAGR